MGRRHFLGSNIYKMGNSTAELGSVIVINSYPVIRPLFHIHRLSFIFYSLPSQSLLYRVAAIFTVFTGCFASSVF